MKGQLVHLRDDLLEMSKWKILFKANGKKCNTNFFFFKNFFKDSKIFTKRKTLSFTQTFLQSAIQLSVF